MMNRYFRPEESELLSLHGLFLAASGYDGYYLMFKKFLQHVVPGVIKPIRVLWNEIIAFVFLVLAVVGGNNAFQHFRRLESDPESLGRLMLSVPFALVMGFFAVTSYLRARKIARQ